MNKITILVAIIAMMGFTSTVALQSASALTNVERYNTGWNAAVFYIHDKQALMNTLFSVAFNTHTDAYKNGFIGAVDAGYQLTLPYTDYTTVGITQEGDKTVSQPIVTFYHQSTAPDQ